MSLQTDETDEESGYRSYKVMSVSETFFEKSSSEISDYLIAVTGESQTIWKYIKNQAGGAMQQQKNMLQ